MAQIGKGDPLIISGAVGTSNTYYRSSYGDGWQSPLNNSVYGSLSISSYGFSIPLSFYYSNSDLHFSYPYFSFNISPSYKRWTLHLGQRTMPFSPYVYNIPFNGVGLQYQGDRLRFGMFYGKLRRAINDDPADPLARSPQYARFGWGFNIGYGSAQNYLDLYIFRARDHASSLDDYWRAGTLAQENLVVGVKGRVGITRWLSLQANAATSALSTDLNARELEREAVRDFGGIFTPRYSSLMRFAGDVSLAMSLPGLSAAIQYKMVEPDYYTLGTSYMTNNIHSLGLSVSTQLFRRLSLTGSFSGQADNLTGDQLYTTRGYVYALNATAMLSERLNVTFGYNGYLQDQADGSAHVSDTTRMHRQMHSLTLSPSYSIYSDHYSHLLSLSANYTTNKNLNSYQKELTADTDIQTMAVGAGYTIGLLDIETDLTANYSFQQSEGMDTRYRTHVLSVGASRSFLKDRNLSLSANVSLSHNDIEGLSRNLSLGGDLSASMNIKEQHAISMSASYSRFNDVNLYDPAMSDGYHGYDLLLSLNYQYTFSLLELKRKK